MVLRQVLDGRVLPAVSNVCLERSYGRVLAEDGRADRDYPPFDRAMRDGFAIRHEDIPGTVRIIGEVRAGEDVDLTVRARQAVEIMTGAPVPQGADAVVMVEHCTRNADGTLVTEQSLTAGTNISMAGCEARAGDIAVARGTRIDHTVLAWLASIGMANVKVFEQLRVAIIATGDELVDVAETPLRQQIRNSNAYSLAAQVTRAGAIPFVLPVARDTIEQTREQIVAGLHSDLVLLSGGVSAGKYDVVERVLADLGATFFFDRVLIQPGAPLVFGKVRDRFFFGLPGNPGSTTATFELFARAAIELLSGMNDASLPMALARLTEPFHHKGGLTRFLPALLGDGEVTALISKGSGDIPALARANAYMVADPQQNTYAAGDLIPVLFK